MKKNLFVCLSILFLSCTALGNPNNDPEAPDSKEPSSVFDPSQNYLEAIFLVEIAQICGAFITTSSIFETEQGFRSLASQMPPESLCKKTHSQENCEETYEDLENFLHEYKNWSTLCLFFSTAQFLSAGCSFSMFLLNSSLQASAKLSMFSSILALGTNLLFNFARVSSAKEIKYSNSIKELFSNSTAGEHMLDDYEQTLSKTDHTVKWVSSFNAAFNIAFLFFNILIMPHL